MTDHSLPPWPDDSWGRWRRFRSVAGRDVWVRPRHMAEEHPSIEHFSEREAVHLFEGWAFDEGAYWDLFALYEAEWGPPAELDPSRARDLVVRRLRSAFERGALVVHAERLRDGRPGTIPVGPSKPDRPPGDAPPVTTWIEVSLVDEADRPIVDEPVEVVDPVGTPRKRHTDPPPRPLCGVPMTRLVASALLCVVAVACGDAPPPRRARYRTTMEQEHLRAAMPPDWREGMTWAIEGMAPHYSSYALEERRHMAEWTGEIEFRVVENDGFEALVEATIRSERSIFAPFAWSMRYAMDPFGVIGVSTVGLERDVESSHWVLGGEPGPSEWVLELAQAPDAMFYRQEGTLAESIPTVSFDAQGIWLEQPDWSPITAEPLTRRTLWRAGDPWPAITEALDENGRPSQSTIPPARFRLIEIDGERIEPVPWSEGHRR